LALGRLPVSEPLSGLCHGNLRRGSNLLLNRGSVSLGCRVTLRHYIAWRFNGARRRRIAMGRRVARLRRRRRCINLLRGAIPLGCCRCHRGPVALRGSIALMRSRYPGSQRQHWTASYRLRPTETLRRATGVTLGTSIALGIGCVGGRVTISRVGGRYRTCVRCTGRSLLGSRRIAAVRRRSCVGLSVTLCSGIRCLSGLSRVTIRGWVTMLGRVTIAGNPNALGQRMAGITRRRAVALGRGRSVTLRCRHRVTLPRISLP
jgi:hypothetical protein